MIEQHGSPMRSWLFTPATRPDRFGKAAGAGADVVMIDLEDSVSHSEKQTARDNALLYLSSPERSCEPAWALRINGLSTRAGLADIAALLDSTAEPDFIVLPKADSAIHLQIVDRLLAEAGKRSRLVALIESATGLIRADEIASATPRLAGLMLGAADMAADLGAETTWEPLLHARSTILVACARHDVLPIDAPYFSLRQSEGLVYETRFSLALGFRAKAAIHPAQVAAINQALTPSADAITEAREILAENVKGVGTVNGRMVDEAVARKARRTLTAAGLSF